MATICLMADRATNKDFKANSIKFWLKPALPSEQPASKSNESQEQLTERWNSIEQWAGWSPK